MISNIALLCFYHLIWLDCASQLKTSQFLVRNNNPKQLHYKISGKKDENRDKLFKILITISIVFFILTFFVTKEQSWKYTLYAVLRAGAFVVFWYFVMSPIMMKWLKKYLSNKQSKYSEEVENVFHFMNILRKLVAIAWVDSKQFQGFKRAREFILKTITYTLFYQSDV